MNRTAAEQRNFVPAVRTAAVRAADSDYVIKLPGTTLAFAQANIFARANGYIETRKLDIGDRVKILPSRPRVVSRPGSRKAKSAGCAPRSTTRLPPFSIGRWKATGRH